MEIDATPSFGRSPSVRRRSSLSLSALPLVGHTASSFARFLRQRSANRRHARQFPELVRPSTRTVVRRTPMRARATTKHSTKSGERKVSVTEKRKKSVGFKKRKSTHLSKAFVKKVKMAVSQTAKNSGKYQRWFARPILQVAPNAQAVEPVGIGNVDGAAGALFSPTQVLDAASVLWNSKPSGQTLAFSDIANFPLNAKIKVLKSWATVEYINHGQRTYYITLYDCKPKNKTTSGSPYQDWINALSADANNTKGINIGNVAVTTLGCYPQISKAWVNNWTASETKIVLEPGQSFTAHIPGPKMQEYVYQKYLSSPGGSYANNQPLVTRYLMHKIVTDLLGIKQAGGAISSSRQGTTSAQGNQVHVEVKEFYTLECPDSAGWLSGGVAPAAGAVPLFEKRDAYAIANFEYVPVVADTPYRTETEIPTTLEGGVGGFFS